MKTGRQSWNTRIGRKLRTQVLQTSDVCGICGHDGADTVDHIIPVSVDPSLALEVANMRPAHGMDGCHICGRRCNYERGARLVDPIPASRW